MHLFSLSLCVIRHPFDTFRALQASRDRSSYIPAALLMLLMVAVRLFQLFFIHYPLSSTAVEDVNVSMEVFKFAIPLCSWALSLFAVTSIMDGETTIREAVTATMYCMMPYILLTVPLTLLSLILSSLDISLFNGMQTGVAIWCGLLFVLSVKVMNNYTLKKTLLVILLTLFGMALIWAIGLLIFALASQFLLFLQGIYKEARYALFGY